MEEVKERNMKWVEAQDLPVDEKVYLKKDFMGWRVVEPYKKDLNLPAKIWDKSTWNNINWFSMLFGGKRNLFILLFLMFIVLAVYLWIGELISNYQIIAEHPCDFCSQCRQTVSNLSQLNFTFPKLS